MALAFDRQTVLITGSTSGIGEASARWFSARGARVLGGDITPPIDEDTRLKAGIISRRCDVRSEKDVQALVAEAVKETGRLDVVIYSAGVGVNGSIPTIAEEDWDRCLDTNFKGAFLVAKHAIPVMARLGGGCIVHVASNAGILPRAADPVYSTSKAALIALTKSLALGHAHDRIRVNAVCPGPVEGTRMMDTDLQAAPDPERRQREIIAACPTAQALGRMATTREVADAIGYLADPFAPFVTGTILAIDGAKSLGVPPYYGPTSL